MQPRATGPEERDKNPPTFYSVSTNATATAALVLPAIIIIRITILLYSMSLAVAANAEFVYGRGRYRKYIIKKKKSFMRFCSTYIQISNTEIILLVQLNFKKL